MVRKRNLIDENFYVLGKEPTMMSSVDKNRRSKTNRFFFFGSKCEKLFLIKIEIKKYIQFNNFQK